MIYMLGVYSNVLSIIVYSSSLLAVRMVFFLAAVLVLLEFSVW